MMNVFNKIYLDGISSINHILDRMYSVLIEFGSDEFKMELKKIGVEHVEDLYKFNPSTQESINDSCLHEFTQWSPIESLKYLELQFKSGEFDTDIDTFISKNHLEVIKSGFIEEDCPDSIKNFLIGESYGGMLRSEIKGIDINRLESIPINLWLEVVNEYSSSNNLKGSTNDFIESVQFINTLSYSWDQLKNVNSKELNQHDMKIRVNNNLTDQQLAEIYSGNYQLIPKLNQITTTGSTKPSQLVTDIESFNQLNSNQKKRVNQFLTTHYNKFIQSISNHVNNVFSVVSSVDLNKFTKEYNKVCKNSIYSSDDKIKSMYKSIEKCFKNYDIKTVSVGMDSLVHGYIPLLHSFKSDSELSNVVYNPILTVIGVSSRLNQPKRSYLKMNSRSELINQPNQQNRFSISSRNVVQSISGGEDKMNEKNKIESIANHINDLQIEFNRKYSIEYNNIIKKLNQLDLNSIKFDLNDMSSNSYPYVVGMIDNILVDNSETTNSLSGLYINKDNSEMFIKYCQDCISKCELSKPFDCIIENLNNIVKLIESTKSEFKSIKDVNVLSSDNYDRISSFSHNNYTKQEDIIRKKEIIQRLQSYMRSQYKNILSSTSTKSILEKYKSSVEDRNKIIKEYFDNYIKSTADEFRKIITELKNNYTKTYSININDNSTEIKFDLSKIESDMKIKLKLINQKKLNYIWLNEEFDKFLVQCRSNKLHSEITETGLLKIHDVISRMRRLEFKNETQNKINIVCNSTQDYNKLFNEIKKQLMKSAEISTIEHYFYSLHIVSEKFNFSNFLLKLVEFISSELIWFQLYNKNGLVETISEPQNYDRRNCENYVNYISRLITLTYDFNINGNGDSKKITDELKKILIGSDNYSFGFGFTNSPITIFNDFYIDVVNSLYIPIIQILDNYGSRIEQQGSLTDQIVKNNVDLMLQGGNMFDEIYKTNSTQSTQSTLVSQESNQEYGGSLFDNIPSNRIENNINIENVPVYISAYKLLEYYREHYCDTNSQSQSNKLRIIPNRSLYISELIDETDKINLNDFNKFIKVINAYCTMTTETNKEKRLRIIIETIINELNSMLVFTDEFSNVDSYVNMNSMSISNDKMRDLIDSMSNAIPDNMILSTSSVSNVNQVVNEMFENAIKSIEHCDPSTRLATLKSIIVNDSNSSGERNEMYVSFYDSIKSIYNILRQTLDVIVNNDNQSVNMLDVINNLDVDDSRTISETLGKDYINILKNSSYLYPNVNSNLISTYIDNMTDKVNNTKNDLRNTIDRNQKQKMNIIYPIDSDHLKKTYMYVNPKNLEPVLTSKTIEFKFYDKTKLIYNNTDLILSMLLSIVGNDHLPFKFYQLLSDSQLNGNTFREDPNATGFTSQVLYYENLYYSIPITNQIENPISKRTINKLVSFIPFLIKLLTIFSNCQCQSNDKSIFKYESYKSSIDQSISPTVESEILINILREFYESLVLKSDKLMFMCGNLSNADFDNMNKLLDNNGLLNSFIKHPENFEWIYSFTCGDLGLPIPNHDRFSNYLNGHKTLLDPRFNNSFVTNISNLATLLMNGLLSYFTTTPLKETYIYEPPTKTQNDSKDSSETQEKDFNLNNFRNDIEKDIVNNYNDKDDNDNFGLNDMVVENEVEDENEIENKIKKVEFGNDEDPDPEDNGNQDGNVDGNQDGNQNGNNDGNQNPNHNGNNDGNANGNNDGNQNPVIILPYQDPNHNGNNDGNPNGNPDQIPDQIPPDNGNQDGLIQRVGNNVMNIWNKFWNYLTGGDIKLDNEIESHDNEFINSTLSILASEVNNNNLLQFSSTNKDLRVKVYNKSTLEPFKNKFIKIISNYWNCDCNKILIHSKSELECGLYNVKEFIQSYSTVTNNPTIGFIINYLQLSDNILTSTVILNSVLGGSIMNELIKLFKSLIQLEWKDPELNNAISSFKILFNRIVDGDCNDLMRDINEFDSVDQIETMISFFIHGIKSMNKEFEFKFQFNENNIDQFDKFDFIMVDPNDSLQNGIVLQLQSPFKKNEMKIVYKNTRTSLHQFVLGCIYHEWVKKFKSNGNYIRSKSIDYNNLNVEKYSQSHSHVTTRDFISFLPRFIEISNVRSLLKLKPQSMRSNHKNIKSYLTNIIFNGSLTNSNGKCQMHMSFDDSNKLHSLTGGDLINNHNDFKDDIENIVQIFNTKTVSNQDLIVSYFNKLVLSFNNTFSKNIFAEIMYNSAIFKKKISDSNFNYDVNKNSFENLIELLKHNNKYVEELITNYSYKSSNSFREYKLEFK